MADERFIGWWCITNRLATLADGWGGGTVILLDECLEEIHEEISWVNMQNGFEFIPHD